MSDRRRVVRAVGAFAAGLVTAAVLAAPSFANTFRVTRGDDPLPGACAPSDCSLREAVLAANARKGQDKVVLPNRRHDYVLTRPGTGEDGAMDGDLDVTNDPLRLAHPGKGRATVRAQDGDRVFDVFAGAPATFDSLVITGGHNTDADEGGGIRSVGADLVVLDSRIVGNSVDSAGSSFGGGIGLENGAGLRMVRSTLAHNVSDEDGGGVDGDTGAIVIKRSRIVGNEAAGQGGAMFYFSGERSVISKTTIAGNTADQQGGALHVGAAPDAPPLRIVASTLSQNKTPEGGGAIEVGNGSVNLTNSTLAGNHAGGFGGGIWNAGGKVKANAITVARNVAGLGGGLFYGSGGPGFDVRNSLIVLNRVAGAGRNDCSGDDEFDSFGHNLVSKRGLGDCEGFDKPSDRVSGHPKIGRLRRNGGPTKTIALKRGSPAIGHAGHSAPGRDQRGKKRDRRPDIGAFERLG